MRRAVRMIRHAISPRLAMRRDWIMSNDFRESPWLDLPHPVMFGNEEPFIIDFAYKFIRQ